MIIIKVKKYNYILEQHNVVKEGANILKSAFKIYFLGVLVYSILDFS